MTVVIRPLTFTQNISIIKNKLLLNPLVEYSNFWDAS
jgi:hypothetical protein